MPEMATAKTAGHRPQKKGGKQDGSVVCKERRGGKNKWIKYNSKDCRNYKNRNRYSIRQKAIFNLKIGDFQKMEFACELCPKAFNVLNEVLWIAFREVEPRSSAGLWSALYFKRALIALPCRWVTTFKHDVTGLFGYRHRSFIVLAVRALESV
jgi:hypothetical protein